ncbi:MAG: hypothetical protein M1831_003762 [Alyxoria varia]|nr:MAG: hypothetical protein M1831_003762 [Alyxoria varia]
MTGDCIQWMLDALPTDDEIQITQRIIGLLFGAAHQLPMLVAFALYNLCKFPEYVEPLRHELAKAEPCELATSSDASTPLLDSFLKETARLYPLSTVNMRRKVMRPFHFSDGSVVPAGNILCVPHRELMLEAANYSDPAKFNGSRFVRDPGGSSNDPLSASRFSHPSPTFPFWGAVNHTCPGRFYATMVSKMVIAHLITNYDIKLQDESREPYLAWGSNMIPHPKLSLLLREREGC